MTPKEILRGIQKGTQRGEPNRGTPRGTPKYKSKPNICCIISVTKIVRSFGIIREQTTCPY